MAATKDSLARRVGARIVALRKAVGLTQEALAWESDASKSYLARVERGEREPSLSMLERLADRLGVEVRDLLIFPDDGPVEEAMERLRVEGDDLARTVLGRPSAASRKKGSQIARPRVRRR